MREKPRRNSVERRGLTVSLEEDANSSVDHDSLLHRESLLVVSTSDSENIALVVLAQDLTINFLTHSSIEERTAAQVDKLVKN